MWVVSRSRLSASIFAMESTDSSSRIRLVAVSRLVEKSSWMEASLLLSDSFVWMSSEICSFWLCKSASDALSFSWNMIFWASPSLMRWVNCCSNSPIFSVCRECASLSACTSSLAPALGVFSRGLASGIVDGVLVVAARSTRKETAGRANCQTEKKVLEEGQENAYHHLSCFDYSLKVA